MLQEYLFRVPDCCPDNPEYALLVKVFRMYKGSKVYAIRFGYEEILGSQ
jgi:hypothetical protein